MSKELTPLEVLKQLKEFVLEFVNNGLDKMFVQGSFDIIEKELKDYEAYKMYSCDEFREFVYKYDFKSVENIESAFNSLIKRNNKLKEENEKLFTKNRELRKKNKRKKELKSSEKESLQIIEMLKEVIKVGVSLPRVEIDNNNVSSFIQAYTMAIQRELENKEREFLRNWVLKECFPKELKALEIIKKELEHFIDFENNSNCIYIDGMIRCKNKKEFDLLKGELL